MRPLGTIQLATLVLLTLVTGLFWGTWFALTRSLEDFSSSEFIHIGKVIIANVANPMRIIFPLGLLGMIAALWMDPGKRTLRFYLGLVALVLMIVTLLITLLVEVPIDNQIKTWTPETIPSGWEALRSRWQLFHTLRTFTSLLGLTCFALTLMGPAKKTT